MRHKNWQDDELILAFNLYCKLPFGKYHQRNPQVVELAGLLGRSPGAVEMKLGNFASLDLYHRARGIQGLADASEADRTVWREFQNDWEHPAIENKARLSQLSPQPDKDAEQVPEDEPAAAFHGQTEPTCLFSVNADIQGHLKHVTDQMRIARQPKCPRSVLPRMRPFG